MILPPMSVVRRCEALPADVRNCRILISDELSDKRSALAKDFQDVRICQGLIKQLID